MEKYGPLRGDDESRSSSEVDRTAILNNQYALQEKKRKQMIWLTFFNLFLFSISAMALTCAVVSQRSIATHSAAKLMDQFDIFSPAMHVVEYEEVKFELPKPINSSKYVGTTNDVENAWRDLAYVPDQMVSMDDFPKLQKPEDSLKVTSPKTGETGYRVGLEVFHQLHCLNMLRLATYPDYHPEVVISDMNEMSETGRAHLDHCIEILRMNLMCLSDVNVFTFHNVPGVKDASPDYESHHVCRNFDQLKQWANDNAMPSQHS
ncbi:hypothetical protein K491DRAFT_608121 [Lophiostoma macrostomum CBS 122681]|uniref:Tat pathway signal sequence n=1 Tax=Lophiostoma macrostomum CBS 122681 TaxID=1314788 RepID=A0A6A6SSS2_9PLEO|nr:hypothetical protein K491DRAFT_608121 [Lophiostoma macrostomum CBS 122681]